MYRNGTWLEAYPKAYVDCTKVFTDELSALSKNEEKILFSKHLYGK
jgi:hypothetical protein